MRGKLGPCVLPLRKFFRSRRQSRHWVWRRYLPTLSPVASSACPLTQSASSRSTANTRAPPCSSLCDCAASTMSPKNFQSLWLPATSARLVSTSFARDPSPSELRSRSISFSSASPWVTAAFFSPPGLTYNAAVTHGLADRSEEHTSELQSRQY